jgi:hypothetical protein
VRRALPEPRQVVKVRRALLEQPRLARLLRTSPVCKR